MPTTTTTTTVTAGTTTTTTTVTVSSPTADVATTSPAQGKASDVVASQLHIAMGGTLSLVLGWRRLYESSFPTLEHEPTTTDDTEPLPDEVMDVVFNFCGAQTQMMAIPAVSRRWLRISRRTLNAAIDLTWAWTELADREYRCAITDAGLAGLVHRFPNLKHIDLSYCDTVTDGGLEAIIDGCPNLQHLELFGCTNVTGGMIAAIADRCPNLQYLNPEVTLIL